MAIADLLVSPIRRPLANAHWSLPAALVAAWCLGLFARPCAPTGAGPAIFLLTTTVLVTAWASHLRAMALSGWRRVMGVLIGTAADLAMLGLATLACIFALAVVTPTYDCVTPRYRAAVMLLSANGAQAEIAERAVKSGTLTGAGTGVATLPTAGVDTSLVTGDGVIVLAGGDPLAVVVLRPALANGQVTWNCKGLPSRNMPSTCR